MCHPLRKVPTDLVATPLPPHRPPPERPSPGDEIVVSGTVQRRFFRSSNGTASRTEVVAERVVAARRSRAVTALLREAAAAMG